MKVGWDVYPREPPAPYGVATPHGHGVTPVEALQNLRELIVWERDKASKPVLYYDELLARFPSAD